MKPVAAVSFKSGFVVVCDDGSIQRYDKSKKRWSRLTIVPGSPADAIQSKKKSKRRPVPATPLTPE
jgi:hypothetical protein